MIYVSSPLPLTFKSAVGPISLGTPAINPFSYGAEVGDLCIVAMAGDVAFSAIGSAPPVPAGWTQIGALNGGHTSLSGGGGTINLVYKRLAASDNATVTMSAGGVAPQAAILLLTGGTRPPPIIGSFIVIGMFVGGVPSFTVASATGRKPLLVVGLCISDQGSGGSSPVMNAITMSLSQSTAVLRYRYFGPTEFPFDQQLSCSGGTNFAGHFGAYIEA
jgi:hypothetical protein